MYGGNCKRQGKCTSKMIVNDENGMKLLDLSKYNEMGRPFVVKGI